MKKLLKKNPLFATTADEDGNTPLFLALMRRRNTSFLEVLVTFSDPEAVDSRKRNALHIAIKNWCLPSTIQMLLDAGVKADSPDELGQTPIHYAAKQGHMYKAELMPMLQSCKKFTNARDTVEEKSADAFAIPAIASLIKEWPRPSNGMHRRLPVTHAKGRTPLMDAVVGGRFKTAKKLLQAGAVADVVDNDGLSLWHLAFMQPYKNDVLSFLGCLKTTLADSSVNINSYSIAQETPLHIAERTGNLQCTRWILQNTDANLYLKDSLGRTAPWIAAECLQHELAKSLAKSASEKDEELARAVILQELLDFDPDTLLSKRDHRSLLLFLAVTGVLQDDDKLLQLLSSYSDDLAGQTPDWSLLKGRCSAPSLKVLNCLWKLDPTVTAEDILLPAFNALHDIYENEKRNQCSAGTDLFFELVTLLKGNLDAWDMWGNNVLHLCVLRVDSKLKNFLRILEAAPLLARQQNYDEDTPMFLAMARGNEPFAWKSVHRMNPSQVDQHQRNAMHLAFKCRMPRAFIKKLVKKGVEATAKDAFGRTVIHYCAMQGSFYKSAIVSLLKKTKDFKDDRDVHGKRASQYAVGEVKQAILTRVGKNKGKRPRSSADDDAVVMRRVRKSPHVAKGKQDSSSQYSLRKRKAVVYADEEEEDADSDETGHRSKVCVR
mmetsp:Transcript_23547/g.38693  ORF Transcript_23547/g.38693 Transcript_23547/m.38693 type:complete len:661 (+) Transcript_23547:93-2075(+)